MNRDEFLGVLRAFLAAAGGALALHGIGNDALWTASAGFIVALTGVAWSVLQKRGLLPAIGLVLALPLFSACSLEDAAQAVGLIGPATGCGLSVAHAVQEHVASAETDAEKALGSATTLATDAACQRAMQGVAAALAARS
jgi:hypothetical protein